MEREEGEVASWHTRQEEGFWRFPRSEVEDGLGEVERLCEGALAWSGRRWAMDWTSRARRAVAARRKLGRGVRSWAVWPSSSGLIGTHMLSPSPVVVPALCWVQDGCRSVLVTCVCFLCQC